MPSVSRSSTSASTSFERERRVVQGSGSSASSSNGRCPMARSPARPRGAISRRWYAGACRRARRWRSRRRPRRRRRVGPPRARSRRARRRPTRRRPLPHHWEPSAATRRNGGEVSAPKAASSSHSRAAAVPSLSKPTRELTVLHLGAQRGRLGGVRRHEVEAVVDRPRQQHGVADPPGRLERLVESGERLGASRLRDRSAHPPARPGPGPR